MARSKKKEEVKQDPVYCVAALGDTLIRLAWKHNLDFTELRKLNPSVKGPAFLLYMGQRVRVK